MTEQNRPRTFRAGVHPRQPVFDWMADNGIGYRWLAKATGTSYGHVKNVALGIFPATAKFRAKVIEAVAPFGLTADQCFQDDSATPNTEPANAA